jgi:hypothetical protein
MTAFDPIPYDTLNSRQKENYNFHRVAARLAEYGFNSMRVTDDWQGADFIACHIDGVRFMKVQLKGRLTLDQKYEGKDIHIAFRHGDQCYVYPHDDMVAHVEDMGKINSSVSWAKHRSYSWPQPPVWAKSILEAYKV